MTQRFGPWSDSSGLFLAAVRLLFAAALIFAAVGLYVSTGA